MNPLAYLEIIQEIKYILWETKYVKSTQQSRGGAGRCWIDSFTRCALLLLFYFFYLFVCFSKLTYKRYLKGILAGAECCLSHTSLLDEKEIKM